MAGARIAPAGDLHRVLLMPSFSALPARPSKPLLPAWALSVLIHLATIGVLCFALHPSQRGAANARPGSVGIVLNRASTEGISRDGNQPYVRQTLAIAEELTAPVLLVANE